jgi:hypothetical protein
MALPCKTCLVLPRCKSRLNIEIADQKIVTSYTVVRVINELFSDCNPLQEYFMVTDITTRVRKNFISKASSDATYNQKIKSFCKTMNIPKKFSKPLFTPDIIVKRGKGKRIIQRKWLGKRL